ncbi:MAG: hypothetical protein AB7I50_01690 [Vicinamibacterales bacterium]
MRDVIFDRFLMKQMEEAAELNRSSDVVRVSPADSQHFFLRFSCRGLVLGADGMPRVHDDFGLVVFFPPDYLRVEHQPPQIIQWLGPDTVWHPNIKPPFVCTGPIAAGESLINLAYRLFEIIAMYRVSPHHALNPAASQWVRAHLDELPLDRRPLLRPRFRVPEATERSS